VEISFRIEPNTILLFAFGIFAFIAYTNPFIANLILLSVTIIIVVYIISAMIAMTVFMYWVFSWIKKI